MTLDEFLREVPIGEQYAAWAVLNEAERAALSAEMEAEGLGGLAARLNLWVAIEELKASLPRPLRWLHRLLTRLM